MGILKRRNGYEVSVYDASIKTKRYVGRRESLKEAKTLFAEKTKEFQTQAPKPALTIRAYADDWLDIHHGDGTRRPRPATYQVNRDYLKKFLAEFGDRALDGIGRREALRWAKQNPYNAKTVSAMFNDAIDDEECKGNPFANRRQEQSRGRKDIHPLTEEEVDLLADIALRHWGGDGYGLTARAWVLFGAWVGCRPGETFGVTARDLSFAEDSVTIRRVKKRGKVYPTDVVVLPRVVQDAIKGMRELPSIGPIFPTVTGKPMGSNLVHHWAEIRSAFREKISERRWQELVVDVDERGRRKRTPNLAFYSLRHFAASIIVDRGGNEYDVAQQLGNSPDVARDTYIHGYRDRINERNRLALNRPALVDLNAEREKRGA